MLCARCGNITKGKRFCTRCGATLPPSEDFVQDTTLRAIATSQEAATLFVLPSAPIAAPMSARIFAPTTRKLASYETAEQVSALPTVAVATTTLAQPRPRTATHLVLLCGLLLAVSGFWWGRKPAVLAQLQAFVTTPELSTPPPPAPPASPSLSINAGNAGVETPVISPLEALDAPPTPPSEDAQPELKPRFKDRSQTQPKLRPASKPAFQTAFRQAQPKPQPRPSLATRLQTQTKPEAILVLEVKGDIGKKGKKLKELCDKN